VEIVTRTDRPDLHDEAAVVFSERWPEFIFHDEVSRKYLKRVFRLGKRFPMLIR
jgi:hypothetical protein